MDDHRQEHLHVDLFRRRRNVRDSAMSETTIGSTNTSVHLMNLECLLCELNINAVLLKSPTDSVCPCPGTLLRPPKNGT